MNHHSDSNHSPAFQQLREDDYKVGTIYVEEKTDPAATIKKSLKGHYRRSIIKAKAGGHAPIIPHVHDVLCGRGGLANTHRGNVAYRRLVEFNKAAHLALARNSTKKNLLALSIVEAIIQQSPPGRFLAKDKKSGMWCEIEKGSAVQKTKQALREGVPKNTKKRLVLHHEDTVRNIKIKAETRTGSEHDTTRSITPSWDSTPTSNVHKGEESDDETWCDGRFVEYYPSHGPPTIISTYQQERSLNLLPSIIIQQHHMNRKYLADKSPSLWDSSLNEPDKDASNISNMESNDCLAREVEEAVSPVLHSFYSSGTVAKSRRHRDLQHRNLDYMVDITEFSALPVSCHAPDVPFVRAKYDESPDDPINSGYSSESEEILDFLRLSM